MRAPIQSPLHKQILGSRKQPAALRARAARKSDGPAVPTPTTSRVARALSRREYPHRRRTLFLRPLPVQSLEPGAIVPLASPHPPKRLASLDPAHSISRVDLT